VELFREALKKWPENADIKANLGRAEDEWRNEQDKLANKEAFKDLRDAFAGQEKRNFIDDLKRGLQSQESTVARQDLKSEIERQAHSRLIVQKEQEEFDKMNEAWLKRQQEFIREAANQDRKWKNEVLASIKAIRVPSPVFTPKTLDDLHPGDILLIAPDDSLTSQGIVRVDPLYRAIDYFSSGHVSEPEVKKGRVSHALAVVRTVNGEILFLDHTGEGSRILNREDYVRKYGQREFYVARPQAKVDGRELWGAAREAALKKNSDYGLFGQNVVCSERAAIAVAKATQLPLQDEHHRLGKRLGPVDITPNDFFDGEHVGKYFLISGSPILPSEKRSKP
jgi:hypothetical protein